MSNRAAAKGRNLSMAYRPMANRPMAAPNALQRAQAWAPWRNIFPFFRLRCIIFPYHPAWAG